MRFVKASERLPDENPDNGYVLTRRVIEGEMISGNLSTRIGFCQLMRKYDLANRDLSEYEWLDESTPAEDWVKVEDGLPDSRTEVNVYFKNSVGWHVTSAIFDKEIGFFSQDDPQVQGIFPAYSVTHWRNLPSPPKK